MLSQLREIVEQVSRIEDIHQALNHLVKETCKAMDTECCTIYLANEEKQSLELMATQGLKFKRKKYLSGSMKDLSDSLNERQNPSIWLRLPSIRTLNILNNWESGSITVF